MQFSSVEFPVFVFLKVTVEIIHIRTERHCSISNPLRVAWTGNPQTNDIRSTLTSSFNLTFQLKRLINYRVQKKSFERIAFTWAKGRTIRKVMGGTKKKFMQGKMSEKNSYKGKCPKKKSCKGKCPKTKIHARDETNWTHRRLLAHAYCSIKITPAKTL